MPNLLKSFLSQDSTIIHPTYLLKIDGVELGLKSDVTRRNLLLGTYEKTFVLVVIILE